MCPYRASRWTRGRSPGKKSVVFGRTNQEAPGGDELDAAIHIFDPCRLHFHTPKGMPHIVQVAGSH